jgi:hypothetical protein
MMPDPSMTANGKVISKLSMAAVHDERTVGHGFSI